MELVRPYSFTVNNFFALCRVQRRNKKENGKGKSVFKSLIKGEDKKWERKTNGLEECRFEYGIDECTGVARPNSSRSPPNREDQLSLGILKFYLFMFTPRTPPYIRRAQRCHSLAPERDFFFSLSLRSPLFGLGIVSYTVNRKKNRHLGNNHEYKTNNNIHKTFSLFHWFHLCVYSSFNSDVFIDSGLIYLFIYLICLPRLKRLWCAWLKCIRQSADRASGGQPLYDRQVPSFALKDEIAYDDNIIVKNGNSTKKGKKYDIAIPHRNYNGHQADAQCKRRKENPVAGGIFMKIILGWATFYPILILLTRIPWHFWLWRLADFWIL